MEAILLRIPRTAPMTNRPSTPTGHSTDVYMALAPNRFKDFWPE
jgi:hypothetical protein